MLKITRSLRSKRITQQFAENRACRYPNGKVIGKLPNGSCPVSKGIASVDFYRDYLRMKGHNGFDIAGRTGEAIVHSGMYDGWMKTERDLSGGIGVDVISNKEIELADGIKAYIKARYWHLKGVVGYDGKKVKYGQQIGLCGNTGASSGTHLHLGYKICDKNGKSLNIANGYYGAFDFSQYYNHSIFAGDKIPRQPLTEEEKKEIAQTLSLVTRMLLYLRETYFSV